jgi:DnaJ-domain-containing protein 1
MLLLETDLITVEHNALHNYGWLSTLLVLFIIAAPALFYYSYLVIKMRRWENLILPKKGDKSDHNLAMVYLSLGILLMKSDHRERQLKQYHLNQVLRNFSIRTEDLQHEMELLHQKDIRIKHVAEWVNWHFTSVEREELLYVLVEISMLDGAIISKEFNILREFAERTSISPRALRSIIASHRQRWAREQARKEQQERAQRKERVQYTSVDAKQRAYEVLGVSPFASADELKKAYRKLVKKHHPDRFVGESETIIKAAEARFIEIQKAYETLTD